MNILAIETSCDETAAAVVADGRDVRSSVLSSQMKTHDVTGGVVPEVAARMQLEMVIPVVAEALTTAKAEWADIDAVTVTRGPGLIGPLLVGVETAKALAYARGLPLIPTNHLAGHLYACLIEEPDFAWPYLGLVVSGGHTELVLMHGHHQFELLGSTRDDAAGEAFDKVGRLLGLSYPGGPHVSKLAESGNAAAIGFPRPMLDQNNFDFSFSGLKTAVRQEVGLGGAGPTGRAAAHSLSDQPMADQQRADVAASFQQAVVDTLVAKTVRAAERFSPSAVLLGGGVAANLLLRQALKESLEYCKKRLLVTPPEYATDNAAMIGAAAFWGREQSVNDEGLFGVSADPGWQLSGSVM